MNAIRRFLFACVTLSATPVCASLAAQTVPTPMPIQANPFTGLMSAAKAHAEKHKAPVPTLSPNVESLLSTDPRVDVAELHSLGIRVIPWTTNDPAKMRQILALNVDGLISDRPDLLQKLLAEVRKTRTPAADFDVQGHRGARGLRPENTLPAFEAGLDNLITTIETDTGVTRDHSSIVWHDQFLNPDSCRRTDGKPYGFESAVYFRDHTLGELQASFVCDKLKTLRFPDQQNDPRLSPVAAAYARLERLPNLYTPITVDQLLRFPAFYAGYYRVGSGHDHPQAAIRAANAGKVRFNLETKILPYPDGGTTPPIADVEPATNHTVVPAMFAVTLCGVIESNNMQSRADVQSFDFRTLQYIEENFRRIPTVYLTEDSKQLFTDYVPATLRQPK